MGKRKEPADGSKAAEDSGSDEDMEMLDVEFEWFDPQPAVDFHGLKTLLRTLFDVDFDQFNLSELSDLILSQPLLGSTVKVDGNESDPYAFLTVLNMHEHRDKPVIEELRKYILRRSAANPQLQNTLSTLLSTDSDSQQVGLILTERFINMPSEVVPPMYIMLIEEMNWALQEKEPYNFSHYLILSRTYTEVASKLDTEDSQPKKKKKASSGDAETFFFHPEDELLHKHSSGFTNYEFEKQADEGASDARRVFSEMGVRPQGHMILLEASKFQGAIDAVKQYIGGPAAQ